MDSNNGHQIEIGEVLEGFLYSYRQLDVNTLKVFEASAHLYSLIELLVAKGIVGIEELDERKKAVEKRLREAFQEADIGVKIEDSDIDKYCSEDESKVDCEKRRHICRAACCKLSFALSWQDIQEGIRWSLGEPFLNAKATDGLCVHLDRETRKCGIYNHRPAICRSYDCRPDTRIWLDFEKMIINPDLFSTDIPPRSEKTGG